MQLQGRASEESERQPICILNIKANLYYTAFEM